MNKDEISQIVYEIIEKVERQDMEDNEKFEKVLPDYISQDLDDWGEMVDLIEERFGIIFDQKHYISDKEYIDLIYSLIEKNEDPIAIMQRHIEQQKISPTSNFLGCHLPIILITWFSVLVKGEDLGVNWLTAIPIAFGIYLLCCFYFWMDDRSSSNELYNDRQKIIIQAYNSRQ